MYSLFSHGTIMHRSHNTGRCGEEWLHGYSAPVWVHIEVDCIWDEHVKTDASHASEYSQNGVS